jgi:transposase
MADQTTQSRRNQKGLGMDYNHSLIKQIEDLTLENESLKRENSKLRADNRALRKRLTYLEDSIEAKITAAVERTITPLRLQLSEREAEIVCKDAEILRLKAIINKDSSNSSKPPSSDGFKKIPNNREKSGKKRGGQVGHEGYSLKVPENLDKLVEEGKASKKLIDYTDGAKEYVSKWIVDIDIKTVYTEIRYPAGTQLPPELQPEVIYGNGIKALTVLLEQEGVVAIKRLSDFFSMATGGLINLSKGTIESFITKFAQSVDTDIAAIKETLLNGLVINTDDTQMRCAETYKYGEDDEATLTTAKNTTFGVNIRTYSNEKATYYTVNPGKGDDGILRDGLLLDFLGILGHDHDKKFYKYSIFHATCCEHLLRDLKGLRDLYNCPWAEGFRTFLKDMNAHKKYDISFGINKCEESLLESYSEKYDILLRDGDIILAGIIPGTFGYDELRKMLARLRDYKDAYLLFIRDYNAPFTNSLAERDLRPCKTRQKISGCFRTWKGISDFVKIMSVFSTWKKQKVDLFTKIKEKFIEPHSTLIIPSG